jgi:uncharacterized damage-inducible protein DinB
MINCYRDTVNTFYETINSISIEELNYKKQEDHWTIREHLNHVCDCEY